MLFRLIPHLVNLIDAGAQAAVVPAVFFHLAIKGERSAYATALTRKEPDLLSVFASLKGIVTSTGAIVGLSAFMASARSLII